MAGEVNQSGERVTIVQRTIEYDSEGRMISERVVTSTIDSTKEIS